MSEWRVEVIRIGPVRKHPNADTLSITDVHGGYPVIFRTGEYGEGDLAVYVPVDSVVPGDDPRWAFLDGHLRIKARKLRGVFSMGLLTATDPTWVEGADVADALRITRYVPPEDCSTGGEREPCPFEFPHYTDIEALRRHPDVLREGEEVVVTEKIHGACGAWVFTEGRLWISSHKEVKRDAKNSVWWMVARQYGLAEKLAAYPDMVLFGEVFGRVQDLRYGRPNGVNLRLFDVMGLKTRRYLDREGFSNTVFELGLSGVPQLYVGPYHRGIVWPMAEGPTLIPGADHVREGIVVKPAVERFDERVGRVVLKLHGEGYLTRKKGGEK